MYENFPYVHFNSVKFCFNYEKRMGKMRLERTFSIAFARVEHGCVREKKEAPKIKC